MMLKQKSIPNVNGPCRNCGTVGDSNFCPQCGQKNRAYHISFKDFFADFLDELLDVDSRLLRSLKFLYLKPGFLTTEYVLGRRISYLPPVRIYLVASVLFFLSLSLKTLIPSFQNNQFLKEFTESGHIDGALEKVVESKVQELKGDESFKEGAGLVAADHNSSTSPISMSVGESRFNVQQDDFLSNFSDNFAKMMFFLLPVAALQLKVLYWRRKKLYMEHLIFSLHVHAVIFSLLILTVLFDFKLIMWAVILASLIYLYLALKNFYLQSHSKTLSKMLLLLVSYGITIGLVMTLTLAATAIGFFLGNSG